ncbi:hypothetical protein DRJ17_00155 [Candidatus Woesearchaeota archaeon]|nr:MAG: hypothetical protein DRJ17_00155 [Candidatus Woesearchaeota archaeon]
MHKQINYISQEEWQKLNSVIVNARDKLIINTIYHTGCTVSELVRIKVKDVDFVNSMIYFPAENTKSRKDRFSRIPVSLAFRLKSYLELIGDEKNQDVFVFGSNKQSAISENRVRQIVKKYADKAGIQKVYGVDSKGRKLYAVTVHTLRHSHIKHAIDKNVPLQAIMKQVGHSNIRTTKFYYNLSANDVKQAYEQAGFDDSDEEELMFGSDEPNMSNMPNSGDYGDYDADS